MEALQEQLAHCDPDLADRVQAQVDGLKVELEAARCVRWVAPDSLQSALFVLRSGVVRCSR